MSLTNVAVTSPHPLVGIVRVVGKSCARARAPSPGLAGGCSRGVRFNPAGVRALGTREVLATRCLRIAFPLRGE